MQLDTTTEFGERTERRLHQEGVAWLTTVSKDGAPQPSPIWFVWDGETALIYSQPNTPKLRHIAANPKVSLHFNSDSHGGDVIILTGEARIEASGPASNDHAAYQAKYLASIENDLKMTAESFAQSYSVPIRFTPAKVRGH
jgi:PPOX class probable F420-dependent enzyme